MAALIIVKHPEKFGMDLTEELTPRPQRLEIVKIPSRANLKQVANFARISYSEFKELNPAFLKSVSPPYYSHSYVKIPYGTGTRLKNNVSKIHRFSKKRLIASVGRSTKKYRIRRGDSLYSIAKKFRTSIRRIQRANKLRNSNIKIGKLLKIPSNRKTSSVRRTMSARKRIKRYRVRKGDSLIHIANKHSITLTQLKRANRLKRNSITIGKNLIIPKSIKKRRRVARNVGSFRRKKKASSRNKANKVVTVKRGDTLSKISIKYNVTISTLKRINRLRNSNLTVGQRLRLPKGV